MYSTDTPRKKCSTATLLSRHYLYIGTWYKIRRSYFPLSSVSYSIAQRTGFKYLSDCHSFPISIFLSCDPSYMRSLIPVPGAALTMEMIFLLLILPFVLSKIFFLPNIKFEIKIDKIKSRLIVHALTLFDCVKSHFF